MAKRLSGCCCCCSIRTGTMIVAVLGILGASIMVVVSIVVLAAGWSDYEIKTRGEGTLTEEQYKQALGILDAVKQKIIPLIWIDLVAGLLSLAIHVMLIVGVVKHRHGLLLPWLIIQMIWLGLYTVAIIAYGIVFMVGASILLGVVLWIVALPVLAFAFYLWFVVQAAYLNIRDRVGDGQGGMAMA